MTSLQAISLIKHWLHPEPDQDLKDTDSSPVPETRQGGCGGFNVGTGAILHEHQRLLDQLYEVLNVPDDLLLLFNQTLDHRVGWFHLLPAHPQHHCEPAGAIRHALETAFWAVTATEQIHFDHELYPDQRRARQPLWRLMAGVAGLLYDSGRIVSTIGVSDSTSGNWPALKTPLESWLREHRIQHYCPHWVESDNRPEKPLPSEYTCTNLLLMDRLISDELMLALKPDHDKGSLWQTFISCLSGQSHPQAVPKMVGAIELARLKSVKLHFQRGQSLAELESHGQEQGAVVESEGDFYVSEFIDTDSEPEQSVPDNPTEKSHETSSQDSDPALNYLKQVVCQLVPENIQWKKDSLVLRWPEDIQLRESEGTPTASQLLDQWHEQGWLRMAGKERTFLRSGQHFVFLQPDISQHCRQWLKSDH